MERYARIVWGRSPKEKKEIHSWIRENERIIIAAPSGSGKTLLIKNLLCQMPRRRHLYFDYKGELGLNKYPNLKTTSFNSHLFLPWLKEVKDVSLPLSAHSTPNHWHPLGARLDELSIAAKLLSRLAKERSAHREQWEKFKKMVADLPTPSRIYGNPENHPDLKKFNEAWGFYPSVIGNQTKLSVLRILDDADAYFTSNSLGAVYDLPKLVASYRHLSINLELDDFYAQKQRAAIIVGEVLERIRPFLGALRPVIVVEEADLLAPASAIEAGVPYSLSAQMLIEYSFKHARRAGCMLVFIVQDTSRLRRELVDNATIIIKEAYRLPMGDRSVFETRTKTGAFMVISDDSSSAYE